MTKNEFVKKYGEEAYQRQLEKQKQYKKQYREQHKEELNQHNKQYKEQHREELKQYNKQYNKQHREERKQYREQHREELKQYSREHTSMFAFCISEQIEQIENYALAKTDNFDGWHVHHKLETHNSDGQRRLVNLSRAELKALDMYYNRPANELVFMRAGEHMKLHHSTEE